MKRCLTFILLLITIAAFGQDTTYYNFGNNKVSTIDSSYYYEIVWHDKTDILKAIEKSYFKTGQLRSDAKYSDYRKSNIDGKFLEFFENGKPRTNIDYNEGKINGKLLTYWKNGNPKRIDKYENDSFIEGKCFNNEGKDTDYYDFEIMPKYKGGNEALTEYLMRELYYPKKARKNGIEGRVIIEFVVSVKGNIIDVVIKKSVSSELDAEAMRVVKSMPKWIPGYQDGEAVPVRYSLPIVFKFKD